MSVDRTAWYVDALRTRVYLAVEAAGPRGLVPREVVAAVEGPERSIHNALGVLRSTGYIKRERRVQPGHRDKATPFYLVSKECQKPLIVERTESNQLADLVADFPGGVSDHVLAAELHVSPSTVCRMASTLLARGSIVRIRIPDEHGGGMGYRPGDPAATPGLEIVRLPQGALMIARERARLVLTPAEAITLWRMVGSTPDLEFVRGSAQAACTGQAAHGQG